MYIYIKLLDKSLYEFIVEKENTISLLKNLIEEKLKINKKGQRLIFNGVPLLDEYTLEKYKICENSIIYLIKQMI